MISKAAIPEFHALLVRRLREPHFNPSWHFHPEYQLFAVLEGTGTRFIGDHVQRFGPGDLVLTGPNLPHVWRNDSEYFVKDSGLMTDGIVSYFREVIFNPQFLQTQEGLKIRQLLVKSERGLVFHGATAPPVIDELRAMTVGEGFDRILSLLKILHTLSLSDEFTVLSKQEYAGYLRAADQERFGQVIAYIMEHFSKPIRLRDIAAVANMSETSFCRYFKERTDVSVFQFIGDLRIGFARKLLSEKESSIARVASQCGYATLSNFNRQFKTFTGLTPREYRRMYAEAIHP
jgi:AraC-like DNA-binding protein